MLCSLGFALPVAATGQAQRIVSLGRSVTEIIVMLGAQDRLIARDSTSSYPENIMALPDVGYLRALSPEGVLALGADLIIAEADAGPVEAVDVLRAAGVAFVTMPDDPTPAGLIPKITAVSGGLLPVGIASVIGLHLVPIAAFPGSWGATILLYAVSSRQGRTSAATMLLAGLALGARVGAATGILTDALLPAPMAAPCG
jgi:hypothetical protein